MIRYVVSLFFIYSFVCVSSFVHITVVSNLLSYIKKQAIVHIVFFVLLKVYLSHFFGPIEKELPLK